MKDKTLRLVDRTSKVEDRTHKLMDRINKMKDSPPFQPRILYLNDRVFKLKGQPLKMQEEPAKCWILLRVAYTLNSLTRLRKLSACWASSVAAALISCMDAEPCVAAAAEVTVLAADCSA